MSNIVILKLDIYLKIFGQLKLFNKKKFYLKYLTKIVNL